MGTKKNPKHAPVYTWAPFLGAYAADPRLFVRKFVGKGDKNKLSTNRGENLCVCVCVCVCACVCVCVCVRARARAGASWEGKRGKI